MHPERLLSFGAFALAFASGCGQSSPGLELARARLPVVGGEPTGAEAQAVVRVFGSIPPGSSSSEVPRACTGTMLAPNLVLTALHCVSPLTGDTQIGCTVDGELSDPPNGTLGSPFPASHIAVAAGPDYTLTPDARGAELITTRSTSICTNDLALIVLDTPLDLPLAPVSLDRRVRISEPVTVVGYGLTADTPPPDEVSQRRWRKDVPVLAVEQDGREKARPRTFSLGESVCQGDSGGPAFSARGAVLGVYSTNVASCQGISARNSYTMLSAFRDLILQAYAEAGATPWLEGQVAPGVEPDAGAPSADGGMQLPGSTSGDTASRPGQRVDPGFCGMSPGRRSPLAAAPVLGLMLFCFAARRRRSLT